MLNTYLLSPLSVTYKLGAAIHRNLFDLNILQKTRLDVPVIGVGNLSFGGSGKTILCQTIAARLANEGLRVGVVCRSFAAESGPHILQEGHADPDVVGDEAAMLFSAIGDRQITVASGKSKTEAAKMLVARHPDLDVLIVDDAYQHHRLHQDVKILIWPKPGAPLREFRSAAKTADILMVPNGIRSPRAEEDTVYFVKEILAPPPSPCPSPAEGGRGGEWARGKEAGVATLLVAGLGPEADFFDHVRKLYNSTSNERRATSGELRELRLPDHADYRKPEIQSRILQYAGGCGAILTTAKDAVKLRRLAIPLPPIYVVRVGIKFLTNEEMFWKKIGGVLKKGSVNR